MKKALVVLSTVVGGLVLVLATAWAAREIDRTLTVRMAAMKDSAMKALESVLGRAVTYKTISPSFLQSVEVTDLVVHDGTESDRPLLTIRSIRVYYSLVQLVLKQDPLEAIKEIRLLNTRFAIDLEKDKDVLDLFLKLVGTGSAEGAGSGLDRFQARITGSNIGLAVTSRGTAVSMDSLYFQIDAQDQGIGVSLRGNAQGSLADGFTFTSNVKAQGTLDRSLNGADLTLKMRSFESSLFSTGAQTVQVVWKGRTIDVKKIQDRSPIELDLRADLDAMEATLSVQSQDMRAERLLTLAPKLARFSSWLSVPLTTSGHVTYHFADGSVEYAADLSAFLEDQLPVHQMRLDASFQGTDREVFFQPLRLSSAAGDLEFDGSLLFSNLLPSGLLTLANMDAGTGEKVNANLSIERLQGSLDVEGTHLAIGQLDFDSFHLALEPAADGVTFTLATSFAGDHPGDVVEASGTMRFGQPIGTEMVEGRISSIAAPAVTVTARLTKTPPAQLFHLALGAGDLTREQKEIYDILSRFSVSADVALSTDFSSVTARSAAVTVTAIDDASTSVSFGFSADTSHVSLSRIVGTWKDFSVQGGFEGTFGKAGALTFTSDLTFLGTRYALAGTYSPTLGITATGSYGLTFAYARLGDGSQSVRLGAVKLPIPVAGTLLPVSFQVAGLITPSGQWTVEVPSVTLASVPFLESKTNTIQASGRLTATHLDIVTFGFSDSFSALSGSGAADITLPPDFLSPTLMNDLIVEGSVALKSGNGGESYVVKGGLSGGQLSLSVQFAGSPIARLAKSVIGGSLSGSGTISGLLTKPGVDMSVALKDGKLGNDTIAAAAQVALADDVLQVRSASFTYLSHAFSAGAGQVDLKKGSYTLRARYQGEFFADRVGLTFGLDGSYAPGGATSGTGLLPNGLQGRLSLSAITVSASTVSAWSIGYRTDAGRIAIDGGPGNSVHGWLDSQLAFSMTLAAPLPVSGVVNGKLTGDRIAATLDMESFDLTILNSILKSPPIATAAGPIPIYYITSGVASGQLKVDGTVNDPDFFGQIEIVGGGLRSAYISDQAGPLKTTVTFEGKTFRSDVVSAPAGQARITAQASFTVDHWSPLGYDITVGTEGQTALRVRGRFGRLFANGSAFGQLHITGDDRKTNVTGAVLVNDCQIALGEAVTGKFVPEDPPTYVAITAETGKRVEFFWPTADVPVLRTTASPGGKIAITYRGDTGAYTIKGTTGVQGGEIYYFDRSFIMKKGSIEFNEDQSTFDPHITASAEVREWDPNTAEEVKIYLDADSTLSHFSPRFSSDPPRGEGAILAMIGAPLLNRAESQGLGMAAIVYSDILSQNWILRPFEQKVRQVLNLDMFSIRTQIIPNLLAQKLFNAAVNPLDNTSVSLGKYLGNDLFLEMLVRLQEQQLPAGSETLLGSSAVNGLGLQPDLELSLEWATPFFLLDWTFLPKHPENLFLSDNSLAFSWRFSY